MLLVTARMFIYHNLVSRSRQFAKWLHLRDNNTLKVHWNIYDAKVYAFPTQFYTIALQYLVIITYKFGISNFEVGSLSITIWNFLKVFQLMGKLY